MTRFLDEQGLERSGLEVVSLPEQEDEPTNWRSKSPVERLLALKLMRQIIYSYDLATTRLQRVFEITRREFG